MSSLKSECDFVVLLGFIVVFALPLTLLVPEFCIWDVIPKIRVTRYHALAYEGTWPELNGTMLSVLTLLFCLYLEIRKRRLDDIVVDVLAANETTESMMAVERKRQAEAFRACVHLLDASAEHYEHLVLLRDELRRREKPIIDAPPIIQSSDLKDIW